MTEPVAPITVVPGMLIDYGYSGGAIRSAVPCPSALSFTVVTRGTHPLNGRVSGRQGVLEAYWTPGTAAAISNIVSLVLGSAHITLATSAAGRISVYVTNALGVDVAVLSSGSAPELTAGWPVKVSLQWNTVTGMVLARVNEVAVAASLWATTPGSGWVLFKPDTLLAGEAFGAFAALVGTIQRVTVRDSLV